MRILFLLLVIFAHPALAQETDAVDSVIEELKQDQSAQEQKQETAFRYTPDFCDFEITFPEAPYTARRCPPNAANKCYQLQSYTMVYDLKTTLEVSVTCVPSDAFKFDRYNEIVMRTALRGMVNSAGVENFDIGFDEQPTHKQASLSGSGGVGAQSKLYTAQLWSGPNSVFTMEASITGRSHPEADSAFSDVLKTVHLKEETKD